MKMVETKKITEKTPPKVRSKFWFIKTAHSFHIVDPSPWPIVAAFSALMLTFGMVMYMHKYQGGKLLLLTGVFMISLVMFTWFRDIVREATFEDKHTVVVQKGLALGVALFIVSEVMFFFSFFWAFFYFSGSPTFNPGGAYPPTSTLSINAYGLPFVNTLVLLSSGFGVTWAHHSLLLRDKRGSLIGFAFAIGCAILFSCLQIYEYRSASFGISDGIYGSCFFMLTGFHGFHVFVGTIALIVTMIRLGFNHFTDTHHLGLEASIWYWHFVDVVWLFLFISVYWWPNR